MGTILSLEKISKNYGSFRAVSDLTFDVKEGEILGFLGLNGSGKTTTIKILAGLLHDYSGTLYYNDKKVKDIGNKPETTFIFDSQNFYENLTAYENLLFVSLLNKRVPKKKIYETLSEIGLENWINKPVKFFSRGMKQRLALSTALLINPTFLILDEPTNGLDIDGIYFCEKYFSKLAQQGCTILLSSHYLEEVERLANHIVIIHKGVKRFDGDARSLSILKIIGANYNFASPINDKKINSLKEFLNQNNIEPLSLSFQENGFQMTFEKDFQDYIQTINKFVTNNFEDLLFIEPIQKHLKELFFNQN